ncbi:MAG: S24 family peptidase [Clostridia bacterium]|nr:S24 family peptidase [Clostridia bacterium]MDD4571736.1 S24 family peptidase [Clostridia bacterium]
MSQVFAQRLREAMSLRRIKQADLVERTGIGKSSISQYLSGDYEPKPKNIYLLAEALGVDAPWLYGLESEKTSAEGTGERIVLETLTHKKRVPLLKRIAAESPMFDVDNIENYQWVEDESIDYAFKVNENSMINARIFAGDIVFVDKSASVQNGDIVIALHHKNKASALINRFYKYGNKIILHPENPTIREREYDAHEILLLGKVKEVKFKVF